MMRAASIAALVLAVAFAPANAQKETRRDTPDTAYDACIQKDPSTAGMVECSAAAEAAWDKEMNEAYRVLSRALKGRELDALRSAQRDWVEQRDREFRLLDAIRAELDGTMWGPVMAGQRVAHVKARAQQLQTYKTFLDDGRP